MKVFILKKNTSKLEDRIQVLLQSSVILDLVNILKR